MADVDNFPEFDEELFGKNGEEEPPKGKEGDDDISIPKARFDEALSKERKAREALEAKLAALEANAAPKPAEKDPLDDLEAKLEAADDAYEEALLDGDKELAKKARQERNALRKQISTLQAERHTSTSVNASREESLFQQVVSRIEGEYPVLDSNSDKYDQEQTTEVLAMMNGYVQQGLTRAAALQKAVKRLMGAPPQQDDTRGRRSREKAADASRRQPPTRPGLGASMTDNDFDLDVTRMSNKEVAELDAKKLSVLRGDYVD